MTITNPQKVIEGKTMDDVILYDSTNWFEIYIMPKDGELYVMYKTSDKDLTIAGSFPEQQKAEAEKLYYSQFESLIGTPSRGEAH